MIVPNFIPDPLEVPGNVTEQPYLLRVRFIRHVTLLFTGSVAVIGVLVAYPLIGPLSIGTATAAFALLLIALEVWRILTRGRAIEGLVSSLCLPLVLIGASTLLLSIREQGYPVWQGFVGPICLLLYTVLCGRDYSFVGSFLLSLIGSSVAIAAIGISIDMSARDQWIALSTNALLLFYLVYDHASLLSRRRVGEELAAVTDLYRDVFNVFGYVVRVIRHWRRHRIWSMPTPLELKWKGKG